MAGMGPAPKPADQRRNRSKTLSNSLLRLPAQGYAGPVPEWPLPRQTGRERVLWERIWRTPQAAAWAQLGWQDSVAMYCRLQGIAEQRSAPMQARAELRQYQDRLGLNPLALLRLRWEIPVDEVGELRDEKAPAPVRRLKAVEPDAVAGPE